MKDENLEDRTKEYLNILESHYFKKAEKYKDVFIIPFFLIQAAQRMKGYRIEGPKYEAGIWRRIIILYSEEEIIIDFKYAHDKFFSWGNVKIMAPKGGYSRKIEKKLENLAKESYRLLKSRYKTYLEEKTNNQLRRINQDKEST